jgi:hypothetical protein
VLVDIVMKSVFWASLCYKGAHGGGLYLKDDCLMFRTNKAQLPHNMKFIDIRYSDMIDVVSCTVFGIFPAITIQLTGSSYKFIVLCRKKALQLINGRRIFSEKK